VACCRHRKAAALPAREASGPPPLRHPALAPCRHQAMVRERQPVQHLAGSRSWTPRASTRPTTPGRPVASERGGCPGPAAAARPGGQAAPATTRMRRAQAPRRSAPRLGRGPPASPRRKVPRRPTARPAARPACEPRAREASAPNVAGASTDDVGRPLAAPMAARHALGLRCSAHAALTPTTCAVPARAPSAATRSAAAGPATAWAAAATSPRPRHGRSTAQPAARRLRRRPARSPRPVWAAAGGPAAATTAVAPSPSALRGAASTLLAPKRSATGARPSASPGSCHAERSGAAGGWAAAAWQPAAALEPSRTTGLSSPSSQASRTLAAWRCATSAAIASCRSALQQRPKGRVATRLLRCRRHRSCRRPYHREACDTILIIPRQPWTTTRSRAPAWAGRPLAGAKAKRGKVGPAAELLRRSRRPAPRP